MQMRSLEILPALVMTILQSAVCNLQQQYSSDDVGLTATMLHKTCSHIYIAPSYLRCGVTSLGT